MEAGAVSRSLASIKELLSKQLPAQVVNQIADVSENFSGRLIGTNRVQLEGKKLKGRLTALIGALDSVKGTVVQLFRNGQEVAQVIVDASGEFVVDDMEAGVYEFVASGSAGFAAISFEAIDAALADSDDMAVALQDVVDSSYLEVGLAAQADAGFVSDSVAYTGGDHTYYGGGDCVGTSFGCGGAVGGSCGACGGGCGGGGVGGGRGLFGRGGGMGRLLLLGAAIAIPLAVSNPGSASPNS
jgi:hypothetical protein